MSLIGDFVRDVTNQFRGPTRGRGRAFPALVWLGFILFPLVDAVATSGSTVGRILTIAGALAFVTSYVLLVLSWRRRAWTGLAVLLFTGMIGSAIALTLASGPGWGFLFTYAAAVVALFSPTNIGWAGVVSCAALASGCSALAGASPSAVISYGVTALGIGLLMVLLRDLRVRNEELSEARAELAEAAVAQERERFARDLHDLLGHTLSVITLKAELAGRLLPDRAEEAAVEVAEVEQVARQALTEVRLAVSGYRQPTLDGELAGARMALSAAGIAASLEAPDVSLTPDVEAVLAWAVREGATNVIRHSAAKNCTIRITPGLANATVEVIDDGRGAGEPLAADGVRDGHGLEGLRERAEALHGRVEAGPVGDGGFRLAISIPVSGPGAPAAADARAAGPTRDRPAEPVLPVSDPVPRATP